jgi:hypothetical protein
VNSLTQHHLRRVTHGRVLCCDSLCLHLQGLTSIRFEVEPDKKKQDEAQAVLNKIAASVGDS